MDGLACCFVSDGELRASLEFCGGENEPAALAPSNSLIASLASWCDSYVTKATPSERPARSYISFRLWIGPIRLKRPWISCELLGVEGGEEEVRTSRSSSVSS